MMQEGRILSPRKKTNQPQVQSGHTRTKNPNLLKKEATMTQSSATQQGSKQAEERMRFVRSM